MAPKFRMLDPDEVRNLLLVGSIGLYALAITELIDPHEPTESGRWGWLNSFLYTTFGQYALPVWWAALATYLLVLYFRKR